MEVFVMNFKLLILIFCSFSLVGCANTRAHQEELMKEQNMWRTYTSIDKFNDVKTLLAFSGTSSKRIQLMFRCTGGEDFSFVIYSKEDEYIHGKGEYFNVMYRVDNNQPVEVIFKIASDTHSAGYRTAAPKLIAEDLMKGRNALFRIITWDGDHIDDTISLNKSAEKIQMVLNNCGVKI